MTKNEIQRKKGLFQGYGHIRASLVFWFTYKHASELESLLKRRLGSLISESHSSFGDSFKIDLFQLSAQNFFDIKSLLISK